MAMTTSSAFGISNNQRTLIQGEPSQVQSPRQEQVVVDQKAVLLKKAVDDYTAGKITKEQFETISKALK